MDNVTKKGTNGDSTENALILQRKQRLQSMVHKRTFNLKYLMKAHEGGVFWLNCILLTKDDIAGYVQQIVPKQRVLMYFYLASSTANVLALARGAVTVKAFLHLLEEWEYYFAGPATQSMKFVLAKNSPCMYPTSSAPIHRVIHSNDDSDWIRPPPMSKFDNVVVYEYLQTPHVPFELDYVEVLIGLCEAVVALYDRFLSKECYTSSHIYDGIMRIDVKLKHQLTGLLAKELTDLSATCLKKRSAVFR